VRVALRHGFAVGVLALAALVHADLAAACSCADRDERDRLESGEVGVLGRVLEREQREREPNVVESYVYRLRVARAVGARVGSEVTLVAPEDGCGPAPLEVGRRLAAFVRRGRGRWTTQGCSIVDPSEFERALTPYPRARGRGRLALLAAGSFGDARVLALDRRGRILGYGPGQGEVREISVCPGERRAAELVLRGRRLSVAVRDLRTLRVLSVSRLPVSGSSLDPGSATVHCADAAAASVHAAVRDYLPARRLDLVRLYKAASARAEHLATARGYTVELTPDVAYVGASRRLVAVELVTGAERPLAAARSPHILGLSPDGRLLAVFDRDRLRLVPVAGGALRSRRVRYGEQLVWLSADRFLFRSGGEARIYDTDLNLLRRYRFFRADGQALTGGTLFGTDRFALRSLELGSGARRTVSRLPDRGIVDLVGLSTGPMVDTSRRAPRLGFEPGRPGRARGAYAACPLL
jgi:hypothetical protein